MTDLLEDRIISEEYKIWKKNVPFMYDYMMTRAAEWPSPTVQWLPNVETVTLGGDDQDTIRPSGRDSGGNRSGSGSGSGSDSGAAGGAEDSVPGGSSGGEYLRQELLLGTNTQTDENFLTITAVYLPTYGDEQRTQNDLYTMRDDEFGAFSLFIDKFQYDIKIPHHGNVHCARYMPDNANIIATKSESDLYIYDISRCRQANGDHTPLGGDIEDLNVRDCEPIYEYAGLNCGAAELAWNAQNPGLLLTGFRHGQIALWDINAQNGRAKSSSTRRTLKPTVRYFDSKNGATDSDDQIQKNYRITDVAWHRLHPTIFGSGDNLGRLSVCDTRSRDTSRPSHRVQAHRYALNALQFNPFSEFVLAASSLDRTVSIFDLRNLSLKLHSFRVRDDVLTRIRWSEHRSSLLAACSDRRVYLLDFDHIFDEQTPDDADEADAILIFSHNGHTSPVYDVDWNPAEPLMLCSVSEDNVVQVWQVLNKYIGFSK